MNMVASLPTGTLSVSYMQFHISVCMDYKIILVASNHAKCQISFCTVEYILEIILNL